MSSPTISAVAFDMDGLLFNTEDLYDEVAERIVVRRGATIDHDLIRRMMGQPAVAALQLMIGHYGFRDTVADLQHEAEEVFAEILPHRLDTMPGAVSLLERLEGLGIPMALTTSSGSRAVHHLMELIDLRRFFGFHLTAEDVEKGKPHPEIYLKASSRFAVHPTQMLVLEDSENGCRAGVAAGAIVVAVPSKLGPLHDFSGAHFVAESLEDARLHALLFAGA